MVRFAYFALLVTTWALFHRDAIRRARRWFEGTACEEEVDRLADELESEGFEVLREVEVRNGRVRHVVVGPTGVFAIETRSWWPLYLTFRDLFSKRSLDTDQQLELVCRAGVELSERLRAFGIDRGVETLVVLTRVSLPNGPIRMRHLTLIDTPTVKSFVQARGERLSANQVSMAAAAIRGGAQRAVGLTMGSQTRNETPTGDTDAAKRPGAEQGTPSTEGRKSQQRRARSPERSRTRRVRA
jgi:nuclease-like protein